MANSQRSNPSPSESAPSSRRFVVEIDQRSGELDADVMHDLICEGLMRWSVEATRVSVNEEAAR